METKSNAKLKAMFIIPSITGIILFMIPVKNAAGEWTVVVKILADIISGAIGGLLPPACGPGLPRFCGGRPSPCVPESAGRLRL